MGVKYFKNQTVRPGLEVMKCFSCSKFSSEHEFYHAHKCLNANNCWHLNIYGHASEGLKARKDFVFQHFYF